MTNSIIFTWTQRKEKEVKSEFAIDSLSYFSVFRNEETAAAHQHQCPILKTDPYSSRRFFFLFYTLYYPSLARLFCLWFDFYFRKSLNNFKLKSNQLRQNKIFILGFVYYICPYKINKSFWVIGNFNQLLRDKEQSRGLVVKNYFNEIQYLLFREKHSLLTRQQVIKILDAQERIYCYIPLPQGPKQTRTWTVDMGLRFWVA